MLSKNVPDIVVSRLPRYLLVLQQMLREGIQSTSSHALADRLGLSAAQIRKDLSQFGEFGKQGTGYSVPYLVSQLQEILNVERTWDIVLIGAGDLGHAIARYQGFSNRGFLIVGIFDNDPAKIGTHIGNHTVQAIESLPEFIRTTGVRIAMLTVPASAANAVAVTLTEAGIQAILNYAPVPLNLPSSIRVENIDPILQLQHMTFYLRK